MTLKIAQRSFLLVLVLFALASCGLEVQAPAARKSIAQNPANLPTAATQPMQPAVPQRPGFSQWLADFKREALAKGISQPVLDNAFANVTAPADEVLKRDQTQPEKTRVFQEYLKGFITDKKLDAARDQWESHADLLQQVQKTYDVPAPVLLALWQTESRFGENQGSFPVIQSLATLAYDGRRSAFFREQLLDALIILQQEHMDANVLIGSWAGAMGQVQFMPSSFLAFAVDFDGDGRKDIWTDDADAAASMANYLHTRGWDSHIGWGLHARLPRGADGVEWVEDKQKHTFNQWQKLGVRRINGARLPKIPYEARLVMPDGDPDNAYLVTANYDVIMDWNHSIYFATAVSLLSDAIAGQ
jgi:membrane-bound lytic murein transglycosylase B